MIEYSIVDVKATKVYGVPAELTRSNSQNYAIITNHWKKFNALLAKYPKEHGGNWKKIALTYKEHDRYFYMPAVFYPVEETQFITTTLPSGKFALFNHIGKVSQLSETINRIYREIVPISQIEIDRDRMFIHFEFYDKRFHWSRSDSVIGIYVPIVE